MGQAKLLTIQERGNARKLADHVSAKRPTEWVQRVNDRLGPIFVEVDGRKRGVLMARGERIDGLWVPRIVTSKDSTAEHDAVQAAMPELDALFQEMHRRRTCGDQLKKEMVNKEPEYYRRDKYIMDYFGREYFGYDETPREHDEGKVLQVITMTMRFFSEKAIARPIDCSV